MDISKTEWIFQILAIGLVLVAESLNTCIEKLCDFVQPEYDNKIGFIKDIAAGAVSFAASYSHYHRPDYIPAKISLDFI